jgi:hypothetical protein
MVIYDNLYMNGHEYRKRTSGPWVYRYLDNDMHMCFSNLDKNDNDKAFIQGDD